MNQRPERMALFFGSVMSLCLSSHPLPAQSRGAVGPEDLTPHSDIALVAESSALRPGATTTVALRVTMDEGWHTYWTNPGDAGLPLTAKWTVPKGVTVGALRFPTPHLLPQPPLMSFGYERDLMVLADVRIAADVPVGSALTLSADVDFLVCAEVCLPASARVALTSRVASLVSPTRWAPSISAARATLVRSAASFTASAWRDSASLFMMIRASASEPRVLRAAYLIPDSTGVLEHAAPQRVVVLGDSVLLSMTAHRRLSDTLSRLRGVLLADVHRTDAGYQIDVPIARLSPKQKARFLALTGGAQATSTGGASMPPATRTANGTQPSPPIQLGNTQEPHLGLWVAMLFAFLGGVVLNLMPCVFPVLSIKILAFVERGGDATGTRASVGRRHALVFTLGVLTTFWALAGTLLALRAGGAQLGWGFQLQSPAVVSVLALVIFALALNLSGVFAMGMRLTQLGAVGAGERYVDSFLTGLLAVVVATPCTAPFMGAALGYALTQHALVGLAVFTALGLGLAAPYILFVTSPSLLRVLPRPGPWLETLKQVLAFPLYATAVWLLWVLGRQAGSDQVALALLFAIALSFAAWMAGRLQLLGRAGTASFALTAMVLAIGAGGAVIAAQPAATITAAVTPPGWEPWSAARVASARDSGRVVFVDYTAAWCLSCQVNERVALQTDAVERAFAQRNVLLLRADWTSRDAEITAALAAFGRSGVPLYALYPADQSKPAALLPAVLTSGIVISALERATGSRAALTSGAGVP